MTELMANAVFLFLTALVYCYARSRIIRSAAILCFIIKILALALSPWDRSLAIFWLIYTSGAIAMAVTRYEVVARSVGFRILPNIHLAALALGLCGAAGAVCCGGTQPVGGRALISPVLVLLMIRYGAALYFSIIYSIMLYNTRRLDMRGSSRLVALASADIIDAALLTGGLFFGMPQAQTSLAAAHLLSPLPWGLILVLGLYTRQRSTDRRLPLGARPDRTHTATAQMCR